MGRGGLLRFGAAAGAACVLGAAVLYAQAEKHPVYVGARVCAGCHDGTASGNQHSLWLMSRHAKAHDSLATPEATEMARLSGITDEPRESPVCLGCHATAADAEPWERDAGFRIEDGVQCEKCHGPGSEYVDAAVMADSAAARAAGLRVMTTRQCELCHYEKGSHVAVHRKPPLDVVEAWKTIAHPVPRGAGLAAPAPDRGATRRVAAKKAEPDGRATATKSPVRASLEVTYKTPVNLAFTPDGREIFVACEASGSVVVVDAATRETKGEIPVGGHTHDVAFSPDGRWAYASNRLDDSVSVISVGARTVVRTIPAGDEPHGLLTDASGDTLFVLNTAGDSVSVIDVQSGEELRRLATSRSPWSLALSPDGGRLLITNALSRLVPFRTPSLSEVTVVETGQGRVEDRWHVPAANLLMGVAWHPSGEFALATLNRTKNLVPMTRILQGWTITNGIAVLWKDGRVDQILLDEPNEYFADVADVAFSPDGETALVTSSGTDRVAVIDVRKLLAVLEGASDDDRRDVLPNHLGQSGEFVVAHLPTGNSPRGVAFAPDGKTAWVANALDDSLTVIDMERLESVARVDLGGPDHVTHIRRGERLFHSADVAFQRQFSCHTCHPDGHVDGLTYDIEPDGIGVGPVDNRTLRGIYDTDPFKWEGTNVNLARQCGARLAVFFTRIDPFTPDELQAVNDYTVTVPRPPNRHRALGAPLSGAQSRGKRLFERRVTNDGREIPPEGRCAHCHFGPYFTDRSRRDVGTKHSMDVEGAFDVPHLNNIYDSAPYLHNGIAPTLEEIWTRYNPSDEHGVTNDMTKDQLNDLIEYLKTL
jgi:YVTN family beta-propeller protein